MGRVAADAEAARDATDGAAARSELPPLALAPSPVELRSQLVALVDSLPDVKQRLQVGAPSRNQQRCTAVATQVAAAECAWCTGRSACAMTLTARLECG